MNTGKNDFDHGFPSCLLLSDVVDFPLQGEGLKRCQRQTKEEADAAVEHS
jgi:hypothetical protein